ncbi:MAG TPA: citrate lyase subunit alpha, partial [Candidatus Pullilachnospira stercoravium]|nr:citrate lyase subunit alpha [Candidatus Pullilachnospira stercoravium]
REALIKCNIRDGMTLGFHHHFRDGDYVVNMVMKEIHDMGIKDITICASSLGKAHNPLVEYIEDGTITGIQSSGVRGKIGEAISQGKLKGLAIMRSHGGRVRAIETGETRIDIAFIGAPTCDDYGNCRGIGGKSDCGVLSYAMVDGDYADKVVAITDCLVPFPNFPAHISMTKVDYVVEVEAIGDPKKIATGAAKPTTDMRKLMMADYCTRFVVNTPYFQNGFSYQTGVGGASIASTISLAKVMKERGVHMRFGVGGLTKPMCDLLKNGQVDVLLDTQDFDQDAVASVKDLRHYRISAGEYADPFNKGAVVNKLDFVILAALEVDTHFNCNVVVGSDGIITGAQGGHPDTAAGAKCTIVITPLLQGRIPAVRTDVTTVTTPGESVDVVITDYGIAINPLRKDLLECMRNVDLPFKTIEELRDIAYNIVGEPQPVQFLDRVVGIIESRDGTIMDVVRQIKPFTFK